MPPSVLLGGAVRGYDDLINAGNPISIRWWHAALVAGLAALAFLPACGLEPPARFEFVAWDDDANVAANADLFGPVKAFWVRPYRNMYIPLSYTAWAGIALLAGDGPGTLNSGVFHLANIMLHAAGAMLVLLILVRCGASTWPAVAGAAVWAVHPLQIEPVVWITGFRDVLSGVLVLAAIACAAESPFRKRQSGWWFAGTALFAAALLAKPSAMVAPVMLAIILIGAMRRPWRPAAIWLGIWTILAAASAFVAYRVQPASIVESSPLWARPLVAADAIGFYLRKLIWPVSMAIDYGRSPAWLLGQGPWVWSWIVAAMAGVGAWIMRKACPGIWWGFLLMLAALLPVLGLAKFDFQRHSTVADRYMYLPMLGAALAVAHILGRWSSHLIRQHRSPLLPVAAGAAAVGMVLSLTWWQVGQWHDSQTLFEAAVKVNPTSLAANNGLGLINLQHGDWRAMRECFERALSRDPNDSVTQGNFGAGLLAADRPAEAAGYLRKALPRQPYAWVYNNLAIALAKTGKLDEALAISAEAAAKFPTVADIRLGRGDLLMLKGDRSAAAEEYRQALNYRPGWPIARTRLHEAEAP